VTTPSLFTHPSLPIAVSPIAAAAAGVHAQLGSPAGTLVTVESQGTTGTLYTVPAGKVFTGVARLVAAGAGSATMSAASGGLLVGVTDAGNLANSPDTVPITVSGGGGGNAISLATTGSATITSAALIGHVK
jgi:hypothetical protein